MEGVKTNMLSAAWIVVTSIILAACVLLMTGCCNVVPQPKEFDVEGEAKITLTENFEHEHHSSFSGEFGFKGVLFTDGETEVIFSKYTQAEVGDLNLRQFAYAYSEGAMNKSAVIFSRNPKHGWITDYKKADKNYFSYNTRFFFKTENAYYTVDFCTNESKDAEKSAQVYKWAKSIHFTDELIYDVD